METDWSKIFRAFHLEARMKPRMNCVYALEMSNGTVKIGKTRNADQRMRMIASGSGLEVVNYHHTEYVHHDIASKIEKACHDTFALQRIKGEFFDITFAEAYAELDKYAETIAEANRKWHEETLPALKKEYDEIVSTNGIKAYFMPNAKPAPPAPIEEFSTANLPVANAVKDVLVSAKLVEKIFAVPYEVALESVIGLVEEAHGIDLSELKKLLPLAKSTKFLLSLNSRKKSKKITA